jgi:heme-degrading monooxygenase HmoA
MIRVFVRHRVADYGPWRTVYDEFEPERGPMGVTGHAVYRSVEDGNDITVTHDFDTEEAARAFLSSDTLRDAMQRAGVEGQPDAWLAEPA